MAPSQDRAEIQDIYEWRCGAFSAGGHAMTTPEWLKPGIYGAAAGAAFVCLVGFSWGGWMTGADADKMAISMADDDVIAALVPVCLDQARTDPDREEQLTTIWAASSYQKRNAVMDAGWATVPGSEDPDRDLAKACLAALEIGA
jgi:hypothetical protein